MNTLFTTGSDSKRLKDIILESILTSKLVCYCQCPRSCCSSFFFHSKRSF
jgi:hypothetical protein